ncbi:hypothetical protein PG994_000565 [Apiospora phragmitis]|uniref:Nitrate reductase [NADPH] n=1 Tax=Apiospora phragmitis TaxID=2905665 RepID=A0ABR1X6N5_9PEZI
MEVVGSPSVSLPKPQSSVLALPPTPPATASHSRDVSSADSDSDTEREARGNRNTPPPVRPMVYPLPPKSRPDTTVLPEDFKTPDRHVPRDPRLIRLTGVHPFNTEAPLRELYDEGFLTSKDLHYVRNHGHVPKVEDDEILDWELSIEGMVEQPIKLTLSDLLKDFEQVTYPITLVCAGNRRERAECSLWTGVVIGDLLKRAMPKRGAKYVCLEGADKLPNGYYGTSVKLNWAMDPNRGILVAHKMNGEMLHPDHGKPVRVVVPGQIGGRSVKWLRKIIVTAAPSDNWYHIYDNRVLPTMVDPEMSANLPETWKDERYAIYDLNTNSATCYPAHGGKRVTRVEVTLDKGKTWSLANISYPEDEYRLASDDDMLYGGRLDMSWRESCFCWCFWDLDISVDSLTQADDIMVRAMDESMMVQPRDMYWSVLGMMNNPWFRVVIYKEAHELRFEHPTQPALMPGGWMERVKKAGGNLSNGYWGEKVNGEETTVIAQEPAIEICLVNKEVKRVITIDELRQHSGETEPWFVINGEVYDGTQYLEGHPGGAASIVGAAGQDASEEFRAIPVLLSGEVVSVDAADNEEPRSVFLQSKVWTKAILSAKKRLSSDTKIFTFDLEHPSQAAGLPVGKHLMMRLRDPVTREAIIRSYTPISEIDDKGKLHILVKVYHDTPERKGGRMTVALDSIPIGHFVDFKGPTGRFEYLGHGLCGIGGTQRKVKRFIMICGGSGITPIFQVLRAVMKDAEDPTRCLLLNGNRAEEDVLLRAEMDDLMMGNEHKFSLLHTLSQPGANWTGLRGRIDSGLLEKEVGPCADPGCDDLVLICGPEPMEKSVHAILSKLGWKDEDLMFF